MKQEAHTNLFVGQPKLISLIRNYGSVILKINISFISVLYTFTFYFRVYISLLHEIRFRGADFPGSNLPYKVSYHLFMNVMCIFTY